MKRFLVKVIGAVCGFNFLMAALYIDGFVGWQPYAYMIANGFVLCVIARYYGII